jgi:hypothetical protein
VPDRDRLQGDPADLRGGRGARGARAGGAVGDAHPELETAEAAEAGLAGLPEDKQKPYWGVIMSCLPEPVRQALEAQIIKGYEYQSDFAPQVLLAGSRAGT